MRNIMRSIALLLLFLLTFGCKKKSDSLFENNPKIKNSIEFAKGFELYKYNDYSVLKVKNPWPNANKSYTYILHKQNSVLPDSLKKYTKIQVPLKTVVATSTTHISSLAILGVENTLVGFPNLDYISSPMVRKYINSGKIKELGNNQSLNVEVAIDLAPSAIIGYGLDNNNPMLENLEKSGLKVILNGDWNEQSPLGKAEWIKFFGALYDKEDVANTFFQSIVSEYNATLELTSTKKNKPTVLAGSLFEQVWHVPQGESWGAQFIKDAGGNYLWSDEKGTGGLALSFEKVLEKANNVDFWIGPGQFSNLEEIKKSNPHYTQFKAFKDKNVYSYSLKKGEKGGIIYFEDAPNRPDLVLKDLVKIFHPDLLTDYQLHFFQKLN